MSAQAEGTGEGAGHVLLLSLGPVQDFIAAARRCRDLWFGSWLLSELAKAAALGIAETPGCGPDALVFPHVGDLAALAAGSPMSVANKIVARVPAGVDPAAAARGAVESLRERLVELRVEAFSQIQDMLGGGGMFDRATAEAQVDDLIEHAWACAVEGAEGYRGARREAERLLAARKATRLWGRVPWGKEGPKSSLDGERESVLNERLYSGVAQGTWTEGELRRRYGVQRAERLCGVGLLKRLGMRAGEGREHEFMSTPHLAAWPVLARLERMGEGEHGEEIRSAWRRYLKALEAAGADLEEVRTARREHGVTGQYDGQLLFEGRLAERFSHLPVERRAKALQRGREALRRFLWGAGVPAPLPYFATLVADGDRMGGLIGRLPGDKEHRRLSKALAGFAEGARGIVEDPADHEGELIYAGGDDVLAFVPLHRAVGCARALSRDFSARLGAFAEGGEAGPSLSIGIGVAHFMTPMGRALETAREAERRAKETRNALAIVVDKRSGPPTVVRGTWGSVEADLDDLTAMHRADEVPDGVAFELLELERLRRGAMGEEGTRIDALVKREAERILRRKQPKHGAVRISEETLARLLARPEALAERLIVARLLAQAEDVAGLPRRKEAG